MNDNFIQQKMQTLDLRCATEDHATYRSSIFRIKNTKMARYRTMLKSFTCG